MPPVSLPIPEDASGAAGFHCEIVLADTDWVVGACVARGLVAGGCVRSLSCPANVSPRGFRLWGSWMHRSSLPGMMSSIVVVLDALQSPSSGLRGLRAPDSVSSPLAFWSSVSTRTQQRATKRGRRPVCLLLLNRLNKAI